MQTAIGRSCGIEVSEAKTETSVHQASWVLTKAALDKFLACLDSDPERAGAGYETIRSKLISFFEWRNCLYAEDLADQVFNRVVRKIDEGDPIRDPATYVFGVARMLVLETAKKQRRELAAFDEMSRTHPEPEDPDSSEQAVECLNNCLSKLPPESRTLITQYYQGDKNAKIVRRKNMAAVLGLPANALRIRAFRLRERLAACMERCVEKA